MTDMSRRDLAPDTMAYEVAHEALGDAGVSPHELGLVIVGNAMAGRLSDQGCMRGQTWLRKAGLNEAAIVNVDNSCAGGSSALHLATMAATVQDRPVLALGVEKMWTGNRAETIAGIEDGLPAEYRHDLHDRRHADDNPAGSILMGLNNSWAKRLMAETGATVRQIAAAAVKAFDHASRNPLAQFQRSVTVDEVLASPQVAGVLTRLMCSSFTDGAAAMVLGGSGGRRPASAPRIIGSVARSGNGMLDYHDRLAQAAECGLGGLRVRARRRRPRGAARRHGRRGALRPRVARASSPRRGRPGHRGRRHRRRLARAGREFQRRPRRPGAPPGGDRLGPGGRAGHAAARPGRRPPGGRGPHRGGGQHRRHHLRGCRLRRHPRRRAPGSAA